MDCVFCSICKGEISSIKVYEDEEMLVFKDIDPKANVHLLAVPKQHFSSIEEANESQLQLVTQMLRKIAQNKEQFGLSNGYRIVINSGMDGGQTVFHLHIHILGGQELTFENQRTLKL